MSTFQGYPNDVVVAMEVAAVPAEFDDVFHHLYPRARAVAFRILGCPSEAEDAAAEAFARALVDWRRVSGLPYLDAWVLRVTANVAVDMVRRRRKLVTEAPPSQVSPEDVTVLRMSLVGALASLPRRQREVVAMRHLVGLREDEVARALGVSVGSVKRHGHRALAGLRSRLGADWDWAGKKGLTRVAV